MKNIGKSDRNIRLVLFAVLLVAGVLQEGPLRWVLWGLGLVMVVTATAGFCPIWAVCKVNTNKSKGT